MAEPIDATNRNTFGASNRSFPSQPVRPDLDTTSLRTRVEWSNIEVGAKRQIIDRLTRLDALETAAQAVCAQGYKGTVGERTPPYVVRCIEKLRALLAKEEKANK